MWRLGVTEFPVRDGKELGSMRNEAHSAFDSGGAEIARCDLQHPYLWMEFEEEGGRGEIGMRAGIPSERMVVPPRF